ncbi:MAG: hypothetical protein ACLTMP_05895 [Eggerthella lenta]
MAGSAHAETAEGTAFTYHQSLRRHARWRAVRDGRKVSVQPNHCCDDRYEHLREGHFRIQALRRHRVQTRFDAESAARASSSLSRGRSARRGVRRSRAPGQVRKRLRGHLDGRRSELWLAAVLGAQVDASPASTWASATVWILPSVSAAATRWPPARLATG